MGSKGDLYEYYYPSGIDAMSIDEVSTQLQRMHPDSSKIGCVEYIICNQSTKNRKIKFLQRPENLDSSTYTLAPKHRAVVIYHFWSHLIDDGMIYSSIFVYDHD